VPAIFASANGWKSAKILADRQGRGQWGNCTAPASQWTCRSTSPRLPPRVLLVVAVIGSERPRKRW